MFCADALRTCACECGVLLQTTPYTELKNYLLFIQHQKKQKNKNKQLTS